MGKFIDKYGYEIGKAFPTKKAESNNDYLAAALRAELYLAYHQRNSVDGVYWLADDTDKVDLSLYRGVAGFSYFYLKLFKATGDAKYREIATESARYLIKHWRKVLDTPAHPGWFTETGKALYSGAAGIGFVLLDEYRELDEESLLQGAKDIAAWYVENAEGGDTLYWKNNPSLYFDAGVLLFLIQLYGVSPDETLKTVIGKAGEHLLKVGVRTANGGLDFKVFTGVQPFTEPDFELGAAGTGYVLNRLYEFTGDARYLDAAKDVALRLEEVRVPQAKGSAITYRIYDDGSIEKEGDRTVFYLGLCHGPAGTGRFYYELAKNTGDDSYRKTLVDLIDGLEALGAPERQSPGFWNTVNYCCGHAGLVHFFIGLYLADHDERWKELAVRAGNVLLGSEEIQADGSSDWPIAFTRVEPDDFTRPLGYYDGAAGIAAVLLELYLLGKDEFTWPRFGDDPFPES